MLSRSLFFGFAALASFPSMAWSQANCSVPGIRLLPGQTAEGTMTVRAGKTCTIAFFGSGFPGGVLDTRIVQNPTQGTATVSSTSVRYVPKAGFVGRDEFAYARDGLDMVGRKTTATAKVSVTVAP